MQLNNPPPGITLEQVLNELVARFGWAGLGRRIDIRCFNRDPSVGSSLNRSGLMKSDPGMHAVESETHLGVKDARRWCGDGWTARVIKNLDDEGWAVEMIKDGEPEPALVGPWTMGRDKKNPKPLDAAAFSTLVKTASEVLRRHEQQIHAMLHKKIVVSTSAGRVTVTLDIVPDDYDPHAWLAAHDDAGEELARVRVDATFKLNAASANAWAEDDFRRPQ